MAAIKGKVDSLTDDF
jgi:NIMA (never in mitosis gene a)-related kinase